MSNALLSVGQIRRGDVLRVLAAGAPLVERLRLALGPLSRLRGLLGRPSLARDEGLLLRPCPGVHTFFMRYPIDVLFLDGRGRIVALHPALAPWRATPLYGTARAALELQAGRAAEAGLAVGAVVRFERG